MDVEITVGGGLALRGHGGGALGEVTEVGHVGGGEKEAFVGPAFGAGSGADSEEPAAALEDVEVIAVLDGGDAGGLDCHVGEDLESGGPDVGFSDGRVVGLAWSAAGDT